MCVKSLVLILIIPSLLAACRAGPSATALPTATTPSITGLQACQVDTETSRVIQQGMGMFLASNPYTQFEAGGQLLLYLVSSGEFGQARITLEDGSVYQADVLYAYALTLSQRVLAVPIAIGLQLPDAGYLYFSQEHAFQANGGIYSTDLDQQAALHDAQVRLPRGRILRLLAYGMVTPHGLDWDECPSTALYPQAVCELGQLVEELYPGQARSFVLRLSDGLPASWLAVGWVFQEFSPGELVQGASLDIPLP